MRDTNKPCQYCGKPFEGEMPRGTAEGRPKAALLAQHEKTVPKEETMSCCNCDNEPDEKLKLNGSPICRVCAHKVSSRHPLLPGHIPCPVQLENGEVLPWGQYPNIDWS